MEFYEVGGCVRDEILGQPSKDIDYTVVLNEGDFIERRTKAGKLFMDHPFDIMVEELKKRGFRIFKEDKKFLTARAQFPTYNYSHPAVIKHGTKGLTADFVLARKEGEYTDGRRPDVVEPGTLFDDLARRDFTMNAIAKVETDSAGDHYIDPFNGIADIEAGIIRCVGDPMDRFTEDALRAVRALRFSVTKHMTIDADVTAAMNNDSVLDAIQNNISDERIDIELKKMFAGGTTLECVGALAAFPALTYAMTAGSVSLTSTMKQIKRG
jgi:tRNA nucleotidyltransferase/poly(A) polymerase